MPGDASIKVAPDSSDQYGKQVDMEAVATQAGTAIYRQRAILVGETGDVLQQVLAEQCVQTRILYSIYQVLVSSNIEYQGIDPLSTDKENQ